MFSEIETNSSQRITEIRECLDFVCLHAPSPLIAPPRHLNAAKGLIFVQLYGVIEYTINAIISKTILYINAESLKLSVVKPMLLSLALNSDLDSLHLATASRWKARGSLFKKIEEDSMVSITSDLMPTDGRNFQFPQLESIWKIFCITEPMFHDVSFRGRLSEIVTQRINIAHGNMSSSEAGSRVTIADLNSRIDDVSAFCSYFIGVFNEYVENKKFMR